MYFNNYILFLYSEIKCPSPQIIQHGLYKIEGDPIFGNSVSFSCVDGYKLVGSNRRNCDADGQWDGVQPVCEGILLLITLWQAKY